MEARCSRILMKMHFFLITIPQIASLKAAEPDLDVMLVLLEPEE